jgi:hypothetical protein
MNICFGKTTETFFEITESSPRMIGFFIGNYSPEIILRAASSFCFFDDFPLEKF